MNDETLVDLTADIVSAHLANNNVAVGDVPNLIQQVHKALFSLGAPAPKQPQEKTPVVSVRSSIKPDYLVCMECGRKQKTLKRHLMTAHHMTPEQYRADFGLPPDYPMVAPNYSEQRRALAHSIGLGRKKGDQVGSRELASDQPQPARRKPRRKKASAKQP
jgi:predicted transcriptional regulator